MHTKTILRNNYYKLVLGFHPSGQLLAAFAEKFWS